MSKKAKLYRFPYAKDSKGYPKIEREMTPEQYGLYKENNVQMQRGIRSSWYNYTENKHYEKNWLACTGIKHPIQQDSERFKGISYPAPGYPERTIASSGEFIIVAYMVLKQFWVDVSIEDLCSIANYGGWHHPNGTWHHFLDVVCDAHGVEATRLSKLSQVLYWMRQGGVTVALLDNSMFPGSVGNCLVIITAISAQHNAISYYFPGGSAEDEHYRSCHISDFLAHTKVLWGFYDTIF